MKQDKWARQLREKLADHQVDAPEGLWDDIVEAMNGQEMGVATGSNRSSVRFVNMRRWLVAASIVACLAAGSLLWFGRRQMPVEKVVESMVESTSLDTAVWNIDKQGPCEVKKLLSQAISPISLSRVLPMEAEPVDTVVEPVCVETDIDTIQNFNQEDRKLFKEEKDVIRQLDKEIAQIGVKSVKLPVISLYGEYGAGNYRGINGVRMSPLMADEFSSMNESLPTAARGKDALYLADIVEKEKHIHPISLGVSIGVPLSRKLSVTSGLVLTVLDSEFERIVHGTPINTEQSVKYLGVPLNVNYMLWRSKLLKVYLSAGGQADWCYGIDSWTEDVHQNIEKDRMQLSVNTSAGIEFNPIPVIGLYAEPGIKYYFDNGSKIENYFKDKPLNMNLQIGLRINLNRH